MRIVALHNLLPDWVVVWLALAAVAVFILGAYRIGLGLAAMPIFDWLIRPLVEPWIGQLELWQQALIYGVVGLMTLQGILRILFGPEAAGTFTGNMLLRLFDLVVLGPLKLWRTMWSRYFK